MQLRSYRAWTMNEALAAVKKDLGADAVILDTRSLRRGGVLGLGSKAIVEVTAAPAADLRKESTSSSSAKPARAPMNAARRAYAAAPKSGVGRSNDQSVDAPESGDARIERQRTRLLAQAMATSHARRPMQETTGTSTTQQAQGSTPAEARSTAPTTLDAPIVMMKSRQGPQGAAPDAVAQRFILTPTSLRTQPSGIDRMTPSSVVDAAPAPRHSSSHSPSDSPACIRVSRRSKASAVCAAPERTKRHRTSSIDQSTATEMQQELAEIRSLVGRVLQGQAALPAAPMPAALNEMYLRLISQDVSAALADRVIANVRERLGPESIEDAEVVRSAICDEMSRLIPSVGEQAAPTRQADRPFVLALIGPTGVGKTTTAAKLAATYKLKHDRRVGLITCDTYRIAAVDQLRTYADIIGVPLEVALSPDEMHTAITALQSCDIVLIDSAGRSQNDTQRLAELREFIDAAAPDEVHLVLSSTAGEKVLLREAEAFAAVRIDRIVLTKLDEAVSMGMVVNVIHRVGKSLSFVTTGQEVPEHIEPGATRRLASMILGESPRASAFN